MGLMGEPGGVPRPEPSQLDVRVQAINDGKQPDADRTFVYYWLKNGGPPILLEPTSFRRATARSPIF